MFVSNIHECVVSYMSCVYAKCLNIYTPSNPAAACVYTQTHVYIHECMFVYTPIQLHSSALADACVHVHMRIYAWIYLHMCAYTSPIQLDSGGGALLLPPVQAAEGKKNCRIYMPFHNGQGRARQCRVHTAHLQSCTYEGVTAHMGKS